MAQIECEICLEEYQQEKFEEHRKMCMARLMFRCIICDGNYVSKQGLWNHLDLHEIADESKELHYQQITATQKLHQCTLCNDQRGYQENLYWKHVHEAHDGFLKWCSDCGENFQSQTLKADHDLTHCKAKEQTVTGGLDSNRQFSNIVLSMQDENTASLVSCEERNDNAAVKLEPLQGEQSCVPLEDNKCSEINMVDQKIYQDSDIGSRLMEFSPECGADNNMTEKESEVISIPGWKSRSETDADQVTLKMEIKVEEATLLHHNDFEISTPNQSNITDFPDVSQDSKVQKLKNSELPSVEFSRQNEKESEVISIPSTKNMSGTDTDQITLKMEIKVEETTLMQRDEICSISTPNQSTIVRCPDVGQNSKDRKMKQRNKKRFTLVTRRTRRMADVDAHLEPELKSTDCLPCPSSDRYRATPDQSVEITSNQRPSTSHEGTMRSRSLRRTRLNPPPVDHTSTSSDASDFSIEESNWEASESISEENSREASPPQKQMQENPSKTLHTASGFKCPDCGKLFKSQYHSRRHLAVHLKKKQRQISKSIEISKNPKECTICGLIVTGNMEYHKYRAHTEPKYKCSQCPKMLYTNQNRKSHEATHCKTLEKNVVCSLCPKTFRDAYTLKLHVYYAHPSSECPCSMCDLKFSNRGKLMTHMKTFHTVSKFKCPDCGKLFISQFFLRRHMAVHLKKKQKLLINTMTISKQQIGDDVEQHQNSSLEMSKACSICALIISGNMKYHQRTAHTEPTYKCSYCSKMFYYNSHLKLHESTHNKPLERKVVCKLCHKTYRNELGLQQHLSYAHPPSELPCGMCELKFSNRHKLSNHMQKAHDEPKHKCSHCPKMYSAKQDLKRHEKEAHSKTLEKDKICSLCSNTFRDAYNLQRHVYHAHPSSLLPCDMCALKFSTRNKLRYHMEKVHAELKYKCSHCSKMFPSNHSLNRHEKLTHEKDEVCSLCSKTFRGKFFLQRHVRSAHPPSELPCNICALKFSTRDKLRYHKLKVHGEKNVVCKQCSRTFGDKVKLRNHVYSAHSSGESPCSMCDLKFSNRRKLWYHMKMIHNHRFKCPECLKPFSTQSLLRKHMEVHSKATEKQQSSDGSKRRKLKTREEKPPSDGLIRLRSKGNRKMSSSDDSYVEGQGKIIMMPSSELRRSNRMRMKQ